ncbi:Cobalamin synthesis protein cobW C-terminal domain-containing protein [Oceanospirillum multiglobuliferum]|uniref:CobW C-terminal domain-containing protein n=1 Tax=Oceanospirillum multiglobuliferum TaxID=64969 RepID=A0A1T4SH41_9GAMM|nr:GTP-binding protein [Oceanospirillum multiglobuliferum]OPX54233.1 hypothetical protein BTE48_15315 [Oceanospirillum multiglobuliferum]SKA27614.1 Cobalamin synthesis protein cobW C-terminal domain-containing protein [Oceanospirillum multiglobuliferum]
MPIQAIPTHIITGFLGVGKTTAIRHLLTQKPEQENWVILVNEFGQIGIDQAGYEDQDGIQVQALAGGCICCSLGVVLSASLVKLIRRYKPDRIIIEPTGIGHPAGILDTLTSPQFAKALDVRALICLVDPRALDDARTREHEIFQDQLSLADILVINKTDLASEAQTTRFQKAARSMFPPKQLVCQAQQGIIPIELLAYGRQGDYRAVGSAADAGHHAKSSAAYSFSAPLANGLLSNKSNTLSLKPTNVEQGQNFDARLQSQVSKGQPIYRAGSGAGVYTLGWLCHSEDQFDQQKVLVWLDQLAAQEPSLLRIKAVFRVENQWLFYNRVGQESSLYPIAYRRDSRFELISETALEPSSLQASLLGCLVKSTD